MYFGLSLISLAPFLFAAAIFVLFRLGYYCLGFALCRHPLTAGILFWLVTGDVNLLFIAVFFELLWLDLFYVGTFVPPDGLFAYLVAAPTVMSLGLGTPQTACLLLLAALPFAALVAKFEGRVRMTQSRAYKELNAVIDARGNIPRAARGVWRKAFSRIVFFGFLFYALAAMALYGFASLWLWYFGSIYRVAWANWGILLCLAALGGLLALRIPWARVCFGASVLVSGGIYMFYI